MADNFLEWLSGTKKRDSNFERLYDPKKREQWESRLEDIYGDWEKDEGRYKGLEKGFLSDYRDTSDKARKTYDESLGAYRRADSDMGKSGEFLDEAGRLARDKGTYRDSRDQIKGDRASRAGVLRNLASLRRDFKAPVTRSAMTGLMMDTFKTLMDGQKLNMKKESARLIKNGNYNAAQGLALKFNANMSNTLAKMQQEGYFKDKQMKVSDIQNQANLLIKEGDIISDQERNTMLQSQQHQNQIASNMNVASGFMNAATTRINQAQGIGAVARGYSGLAGQEANLATHYGGRYEGTRDRRAQMGASEVARQDKFRLSDMNRQDQIDTFNESRGMMGMQNLIGAGKLASGIWSPDSMFDEKDEGGGFDFFDWDKDGLQEDKTVASNNRRYFGNTT